jgi:hypothetical protein
MIAVTTHDERKDEENQSSTQFFFAGQIDIATTTQFEANKH